MNPFLLSPRERMKAWREFRNSLDGLNEEEQMEKLAEWSTKIPISKHVLDIDSVEDWPGPWELLNDGEFDEIAIAYLMGQTLKILGWDPARLELLFVRNYEQHVDAFILLVDGKWALNYQYGLVINFDNLHRDCSYLVRYKIDSEGNLFKAANPPKV